HRYLYCANPLPAVIYSSLIIALLVGSNSALTKSVLMSVFPVRSYSLIISNTVVSLRDASDSLSLLSLIVRLLYVIEAARAILAERRACVCCYLRFTLDTFIDHLPRLLFVI